MIIVIDTNIWISKLGLRSGLGSAVRHFITQKEAKVGLPEIVILEAETNLRTRLKKFTSNILKSHSQLLTLFGSLKEVVLPDETEIEERVSSLFNDLGVPIVKVPFSLEHARNSFMRIPLTFTTDYVF